MLKKIRLWLERRRVNKMFKDRFNAGMPLPESPRPPELFTKEQVKKIAEEYGQVRYNDGKRDGLTIARQQATKSLKEILWQQNQQQNK